MCDVAAFAPSGTRPALTAITGLFRAAAFAQLGNELWHRGRWCADDRQIRRSGKVSDSAEYVTAGDHAVFRIDGPDVSLKSCIQQIPHHVAADTAFALGCANQRDGAGPKQELEIANGHIKLAQRMINAGVLQWASTLRATEPRTMLDSAPCPCDPITTSGNFSCLA